MIISLKLTPQDEKCLKDLAAGRGISVSEYISRAVEDHLDYETDFQCHRKNLNERNKRPVIYSLDNAGRLIAI